MTTAPAPPWTYTLRLPNDPRAPRVARGTVRGVLPLYGLEALADTAELVTNAVTHTRGPAALRLRADGVGVRIGVSDSDPHIPAPFDRAAGPRGAGAVPLGAKRGRGRGLALVRLCAQDWGGFPLGDPGLGTRGKFLWCVLTLRREEFGIAA